MTSRKPAKSLTNIPGPGTYNSEYDKLPKTPRATIGRSKRLLISLGPDNPGPGDYSPSSV